MLIATSPRLPSDQEKNKSTEDACPVEVICASSKCNSGIIGGKRGDIQIYEDHSMHRKTSTSQSTYMTDRITTEKELSGNQQTPGQSPVYCSSAKSEKNKSDTHCYTKYPTKSQGEESIYYIEHAEAPSEELDKSLQIAVQTDEFCSFLQTATVESEETNLKTLTVQSEELHSAIQMSTSQSVLGRALQNITEQSEQPTNLQISTVKSDKLCTALKASTLQPDESSPLLHNATVHSEKPFTSLHTTTTQSEKPLKSLHTKTVQSEKALKSLQSTVQSEELCGSIQMADVLSEKPLDCLHADTANSEGPCSSLWTATDQSEELNRSLESKEFFNFPNTTSPQSLDLYESKKSETAQSGEHYNLQQPAYIRLDDLYHREQAVPDHSDVQSMQPTTVQAECHHTTDTTEDQVDNIFNSKQRSTQFAESYYIKQASTVQSEEIYLSRTCNSHWSDSITANKVAVEGDFNG